MRSRFQFFFETVPRLVEPKLFGYQVYAPIQNAKRLSKLQDHAETGIGLEKDGGYYKAMLSRSR